LAAGLMMFHSAVRGDSPSFSPSTARSVSGQFIISTAPDTASFYRRPDAGTNTEILHLQAPWLAVSAERFKSAAWRELGLAANAPWSGKIFLVLHPARSLDEPVLIASQPFIHVWDYRVELPDLIHRNRFARALSAVLLLELANRNVPVTARSAEIPAWLVDGLSRQVVGMDDARVILSAPNKMMDGLAQTRINETRRGLDPLADARLVLQNYPALTFDQLSWPTDAQLNGADNGVYLASAQLFMDELLALKNGPSRMRDLLAQLPTCQNWQSAFFRVFWENFRRPLDVEKWWSLRVFAFAAHAPGPQWTVAVSRARLDAILSVPVEIRYTSNALPSHAEITLQAAIQQFEPPRQTAILETKLRDLELVELRLAPPLGTVAEGYRVILMDFLGEVRRIPTTKRNAGKQKKVDMVTTLKKLDALDAHRHDIEAKLDSQALHLPGQ
jgi:hypothetical protein